MHGVCCSSYNTKFQLTNPIFRLTDILHTLRHSSSLLLPSRLPCPRPLCRPQNRLPPSIPHHHAPPRLFKLHQQPCSRSIPEPLTRYPNLPSPRLAHGLLNPKLPVA